MTNPKAFIHIQKLHAANFPISYPLDITPAKPVSISASIRMSNARAVGLLATFDDVLRLRHDTWAKHLAAQFTLTSAGPYLAVSAVPTSAWYKLRFEWINAMYSLFNDGFIAAKDTWFKHRFYTVIFLKILYYCVPLSVKFDGLFCAKIF
jgi:hypothetical protein